MTNETKQTAVEWLIQNLCEYFPYEIGGIELIVKRAKEKEKQQSISDYCAGFIASGEGWNGEYGLKNMLNVAEEIDAEEYYLATYGGGEE